MRTLDYKLLLIAFFLPIFSFGQTLSSQFFQNHKEYKESTITSRRFKHKDIIPLIQKLPAPFEIKKAGESMEGKAIYLVKLGTGKTKVLLWSQMHGDESTATMAIMDIFNFFSQNGAMDEWKNRLLDSLTLYFIPMLNPDGADRFRRRTALNIDLNRDALRLQTTEAQILKTIRDETNADWGFNLHDQSRYYSVGNSNNTATISFLAPAFNYEKDINEIRKRAMQEIGLMNRTLQQFIPNHVAKYNDDFEPRAFGDNIQKWGTSTILIESGGYKNDQEKQFIRKMNYIALLTAFDHIATQKYKKNTLEGYESIPFNGRYFHELLIRNATIIKNKKPYIIDLAFRRNEIQYDGDRSFYFKAYLSDIGDLSTFFGYEELNASSYTIIPGKLYPKTIKSWKKFKKLNLKNLHQDGYTAIRIKNISTQNRSVAIPLQLLSEDHQFRQEFNTGRNPSFFLEKDGKKIYLVINGQLHQL